MELYEDLGCKGDILEINNVTTVSTVEKDVIPNKEIPTSYLLTKVGTGVVSCYAALRDTQNEYLDISSSSIDTANEGSKCVNYTEPGLDMTASLFPETLVASIYRDNQCKLSTDFSGKREAVLLRHYG